MREDAPPTTGAQATPRGPTAHRRPLAAYPCPSSPLFDPCLVASSPRRLLRIGVGLSRRSSAGTIVPIPQSCPRVAHRPVGIGAGVLPPPTAPDDRGAGAGFTPVGSGEGTVTCAVP